MSFKNKGRRFLVLARAATASQIVGSSALGQLGITQAGEATSTATGNQDAFAVTARVMRLNNATLLTIRGIAAGIAGQRVTFVSVGAGIVEFAHQHATPTAADKLINFVTVGNTPLAAGAGVAEYEYDATTARWRLLEHDQGAWITPTYSAGFFSSAGGGTWTVAAGDVGTFAFYLKGKTLQIAWYLATTTTSGTLNYLILVLPNSYVAAKRMQSSFIRFDGTAGTALASTCDIFATETFIRLFYSPVGTAWAASTDNMYASGQMLIELT